MKTEANETEETESLLGIPLKELDSKELTSKVYTRPYDEFVLKESNFYELSSEMRKTEGYIEFLLKVKNKHSSVVDIDAHFCTTTIDELSVHNGLIKTFIVNTFMNILSGKCSEKFGRDGVFRFNTKTETEWLFLNNHALGAESDDEAFRFLFIIECVRRFLNSDDVQVYTQDSKLERVLMLSYLIYSGKFSTIRKIYEIKVKPT